MSAANTFQSLNGNFKEVYADKIRYLVPDMVKLANMVPFVPAAQQNGNLYHQPVSLNLEQGFTYGGEQGNAFNLQTAIASNIPDARIQGHEMVLRSFLSYGAASRAVNSKASFEQSTKILIANMVRSFARRLETQHLYGQAENGIGKIETVSGTTLSLYAYEWAGGIWSGAENMEIEIFSPAGALRGSAAVTSVDISARTVTLNGLPAGTVADDVIFYKGAKGKEFAGLHKIITNTGTLFNIDASQYALWSGNIVDVGTDATTNAAVLSFAKIEEAVAQAMEKGLADDDVIVLVNPKSWKNLLTEQTAKRRYDSSYSADKLEDGSKAIKFYGQNGDIEIHSSIYVKEGYAYVVPIAEFMRIGSTDVTFERPGRTGEFFRELESAAGYELRAYTDQALFCAAPGKTVLLRYIKS